MIQTRRCSLGGVRGGRIQSERSPLLHQYLFLSLSFHIVWIGRVRLLRLGGGRGHGGRGWWPGWKDRVGRSNGQGKGWIGQFV